MKLISFDVGIRNMAYCIFHVSKETGLQILDWRVINLAISEEEGHKQPPKTCSCIKKAKPSKIPKRVQSKPLSATPEICMKPAKYEWNNTSFCEKHALERAHECIIPTKDNRPTVLKKKTKEELLEWLNPAILATIQDSHLSSKKKILDAITDKFMAPIATKRQISTGDIDLITIGQRMRHHLDHLGEVTHVIIENQISPLAARMKTIQGMLAQYFIMAYDQNACPQIAFVSSANKLKGFVEASTKEEDAKKGDTYKKHKIDGVAICSRFVDAHPEWNVSLENYGKQKKDDLADCFLQGIWYLKHEKIITYAENLKINLV